jgi:hypothetical protein
MLKILKNCWVAGKKRKNKGFPALPSVKNFFTSPSGRKKNKFKHLAGKRKK